MGTQTNERYNQGFAVHLTQSNIGTSAMLPVNQPIELAFDRLLLPITVNRQSFPLVDSAGVGVTCSVAYDPVARVVTLTPQTPPLAVGSTYKLTIVSPSVPTDPSGLHAIDGATLDPNTTLFPRAITFQVAAAGAAPATYNGIVGPRLDFCNDILPILSGGGTNCAGASTCHSGNMFAQGAKIAVGLLLTGPNSPTPATPAMTVMGVSVPASPAVPSAGEFIKATAVDRLSVESAMGALAQPGPASLQFGQEMPIIGTGDPGNSYLIYKVLMAAQGALGPTEVALPNVYSLPTPWAPMSDSDRLVLSSLIVGREMPLSSSAVGALPGAGLPPDDLERLSIWIAQGAHLADCP